MQKLIRLPEVLKRTGKTKSPLYRDIAAGRFPKPVKISPELKFSAVGWVESEINEWIAQRIAERDASDAA